MALNLFSSPSLDNFSQAVAYGLLAAANVLFFVFLFLQMVRGSGLAETHFRWKEHTIKLVKHQLLWFGPLVIPFVFILQTTNNQPLQGHFDGLGRLSFICITVLMTGLIYKLINPHSGLFKDAIAQHQESWLNRTRYIWFPILLCLPLILSATAIAGYLYTATELMMLLIDSFWIVLAAIITRGFLLRWLNIAQRKLAMEQIRKRMAAQSESGQEPDTDIEVEFLQPVAEQEELDINQISSQSYKLLNNFTGLAIIIGLYLIWADILPALNMLDNVTLWQSETIAGDGQITTTSITLTNGLTALAILLVTTLIGVNIPGLLEIAILQRLPFTPSARYGITTIARYIIVIIGTILTFNALGVGWSKVQWLAAAITVGLGFGLQEIFANFVSGIIILIERQVRVGDAVTVGDISGRVSKIKMRATTIVDWDKKELIIPNKEFVTGQVVNWTLSDTVIRLVIPVGVAYGSDTEKVHDILIHIATNNKYILKDPEPEAFFAGFGESTLDFELRV
ncbi:MAG: mechanosensitive ion channel, partial [Gammaproteobacteria bacterium]|nr:mechanosensitive ion channel [Gammaproteobacteria bacterium]